MASNQMALFQDVDEPEYESTKTFLYFDPTKWYLSIGDP